MLKKNHKKLVPMVMVLIMAALLVSCLSMNVFAGTGKNDLIEMPKCVVKIQGDSSRCMKKSDLVQLETTLCEGAKFKGFESGDPEVATVNSNGVVEAVGPGETTITAKARLKGSSKIYTATCDVIVTGFVAESIEIKGDDSTVKGTVYGKDGKQDVNGNLSEAGIGDVIEVDNSYKTIIKDTVILQSGGTLNVNVGGTFDVGGPICSNGTLNVAPGDTLIVDQGGKFQVKNGEVYNTFPAGNYTNKSWIGE